VELSERAAILATSRRKIRRRQEKLNQRYHQLLETTSRVVGQAKRFSNEVAEGVKRSADMLQLLALDVFKAKSGGYPKVNGPTEFFPGTRRSRALILKNQTSQHAKR
jgi:hypothetical protein